MAHKSLPSNVAERIAVHGPSSVSDGDLLTELCGRGMPRGWPPALTEISWAGIPELEARGYTTSMATKLAVAFELGRRAAWERPQRGERCLDPDKVASLCRDLAAADLEHFAVISLDVRGRLLARDVVCRGSMTQCPVDIAACCRAAIRVKAHACVLVHNHPSGDPSPSPEDHALTDRLRAAFELVGVLCRDHVIVAASGRFSYVEAGLWRG
jgi:DNA repair protein RadC